mgnify:CR=1 FL=1
MERILALDFGKKRIGLALSDPLGLTAQGLETFERTRIRDDLAGLQQIAQRHGVTRLLLGNPLQMSGDESKQSEKAREFGERLRQATGLPVDYWDERYTTVLANQVLSEARVTLEKRKAQVDKIAAMILLEDYLEHRRFQRAAETEPHAEDQEAGQ